MTAGKHWGESFSQGVRIFRVVDFDGREQCLSLRASGGAGWSATHLESGGESTDVKLGCRELKIGHDPSCDVVLMDPTVAPQHCRIFERAGELMVLDRGAGVMINGQRCFEPTRLEDGDRIEIGRSMIELLRGRSQSDLAKVSRYIRHRAASWSQGDEERWLGLYERLRLAAAFWSERGRPRRRLLAPDRVDQAIEIEKHVDLEELVDEYISASMRRCRRRQAFASVAAGGVLGLLFAALILTPVCKSEAMSEEVRPPGPDADKTTSLKPGSHQPSSTLACEQRLHRVIEIDTVESLARDYGVQRADIRRENEVGPGGELVVGSQIRLCSSTPEIERTLEAHLVGPGDTWESVASEYDESAAFLREQVGIDVLVPGNMLRFWARRREITTASGQLPQIQVPVGAKAEGSPTTGRLDGGLRFESEGSFDVRCPMNAYVSSYTYASLYAALMRMRTRYHYKGQLVVADISRDGGGGYGLHVSHKTGRDVDLWLPIEGGQYRTGPGCGACGTPWCRPDASEVDWEAAWLMIESLRENGAVQRIFLDRSLMGSLIDGAVRTGANRSAVKMIVGSRGALVGHSANHTHHIHVRFHCGPDEEKCVKRARRGKG